MEDMWKKEGCVKFVFFDCDVIFDEMFVILLFCMVFVMN